MANSLLVKLGFTTDKQSVTSAVSGIDGISNAVSGLHRKMKQTIAVAGIVAFGAGIKNIAASIKNTVTQGFEFAEEFAKTGDKIAKTSRLVGLSVKDYQAFASAAQHAGMSTEEMDSALKKFNVNLGKARSGDKTSLKMFDAILGGKSIFSFKDSTSLIAAIANGYQKLGSAEQKAFVSQELFGRSGLKMSELLSQGDEGIKKLISDFESHGGGFTEEGAKNAEAFDDALQDMRETINSLKVSVAQELFPTFIDLFKTIQNFVKDNRDALLPVVREIFGKVGDFVKSLLPQIPKILNTVLSVVQAIGPGVIFIVGAVVPLLPAIGQILFGLWQILPIIKVIGAAIGGPVLGYVALVVAAVVSWGIAIKSVYDNFDLLKSFIVDDVLGAIKDFGNQFVEVAKWMWGGFKSIFIDPWWNFFTALPDAISDLWECFKTGVSEIGNLLYDTFIGSVKSAVSGIKSIVKGIPVLGNLFGDDDQPSIRDISSASAVSGSSSSSLGASVAQAVSESHTTTTSRFAVDFKNMPRGVQVTAPDHGDFDYSRGYVLAGM